MPASAQAALGDLDPSYGSAGIAFDTGRQLNVSDGYLDAAGRAVYAGIVPGGGAGAPPVVSMGRFTATGASDPAIDAGVPVSGAGDVAIAAAPADGFYLGSDSGQGVQVRRLDASGSNIAWTRTIGLGASARLGDLVTLPSGDVLAFGTYVPPAAAATRQLFVARLLASSGADDPAFGPGGPAPVALGTNDVAGELNVAANGDLLLAATDAGKGGFVARVSATGQVVTSFGSGGAAATGAINGTIRSAVELPGGGILAVGSFGAGADQTGMAARLLANGAPDNSFGNGGTAFLQASGQATRFADVALDAAGRAVIGGDAVNPQNGGTTRDFVLAGIDDAGLPDRTVAANAPQPGVLRVTVAAGQGNVRNVAVDAAGRAHVIGQDVDAGAVPHAGVTRHQPNSPPAAAFTAPALTVDEPGNFDATASSDPEHALRRYEWDFDGDGSYETDGGTNPVRARAFGDVGPHVVGLRVSDDRGASATTTRTVEVTTRSQPSGPTARLSKSAVVQATAGVVLVRLPNAAKYVPIEQVTEIPVGTIVDARHGRALLTVARDSSGATDSAVFYLGKFRFTQPVAAHPIATLELVGGSFKGCGPAHPKLRIARAAALRATAARKRKKRVIRRLWGDGHGRFRTKGRYASATVRGTKWETVDRCDGVGLNVARGVVSFRDLLRGRKASDVRAGHHGFVPSKKAARK